MSAEPLSGMRNALRAWQKRVGSERRRLKFTRQGKWYVGFTFVIGLAAINTGNNLLFLILGLLLAGIVLSGVLSEWTLRGLGVERLLPLELRAGRAALVGLRVRNLKDRGTSFAVVARDVTDRGLAGSAFVLKLEPGEARDVSYRWEPVRRGRVGFVAVELATRFPFGLFEKWRTFELPAEAVVFPREVPAPSVTPRRAAPHGEQPSGSAGTGSEFFALRDLRAGDDARLIHWRTSARRGRPVVVERERERRRRVAVLLDNRAAHGRPEAELDGAVESAAALVRAAVHEGCEFAFSASEVLVPPGAGGAHERRVLRELALLEPKASGAPPAQVSGAEVLEISAVGRGAA